MPALPYQDQLLVPIEWAVTPIKTTMMTGALNMSGTIGWRPYRETATLVWSLPKGEALTLLNQLKATAFNSAYEYTCTVRGPIRVRPTDSCGFGETRGSLNVTVSVSVEVV
jgi:hypothetical protein